MISDSATEMVTKGRVVRSVEELDDDTIRAIAKGSMPAEYAYLDELLKDWTP